MERTNGFSQLWSCLLVLGLMAVTTGRATAQSCGAPATNSWSSPGSNSQVGVGSSSYYLVGFGETAPSPCVASYVTLYEWNSLSGAWSYTGQGYAFSHLSQGGFHTFTVWNATWGEFVYWDGWMVDGSNGTLNGVGAWAPMVGYFES